MGTDTNGVAFVDADARRSVRAAIKLATAADVRPALRAVIVDHGYALVTDTYLAVNLPTLAGLPVGAYDADALALAVKAGGRRDVLRVGPAPDGDGLLAELAEPPHGVRHRDALADGVPSAWSRGTWRIGTVEGAPNVAKIYTEALEAVADPAYVPELADLAGKRVAALLAAAPPDRNGGDAPVRIHPRGLRPAVFAAGGDPYAVLMPMRVA